MITSIPIAATSLPGPIQPGLWDVVPRMRWTSRTRWTTCARNVERQSAAQRHRGDRGQRLVDVLDRLLQPEREEHDPGDHRQVQVAVVVASEPDARRAVRLGQLTLRQDGEDVEVRPPERGDDDDSEDGGGDDPGGDRLTRGADPDGDDRLAERDDDDEPVALGEVCGRDAPSLPAASQRAEVVDCERGRPERCLRGPVEERGDDEDHRRNRGRGREARDRAEQVWIPLAGDRVEQEVEQAHGEVGDAEQHGVRVERLRDGEGDDQHRRHRSEHPRPYRPSFGLERVREPCVPGPRPPERREDQHPLADPPPGEIVGHEQRDLRDRVDEDQVEEELERGDPLLALGHRRRLIHSRSPDARPRDRRRGGRSRRGGGVRCDRAITRVSTTW